MNVRGTVGDSGKIFAHATHKNPHPAARDLREI